MSTRANIVVKDSNSEHTVYHHCDGYVAGVGKELKTFIDKDYKPDSRSADEFCKQIENWDYSYEYDDCGVHGDVEYIYYVYINSTSIEVSATHSYYDKRPDGKFVEVWEPISEYYKVFKK